MLKIVKNQKPSSSLVDGEVQIFFLSCQELCNRFTRELMENALSSGEIARLRTYLDTEAESEYLAGRIAIRSLLSHFFPQFGLKHWLFESSEFGKPRVSNPPENRTLSFSLSHSRGLLGCAIASGIELGLDVEMIDEETDCRALAENFFSPHEISELRNLNETDLRIKFFETWTLKEAYLKAVGLGLNGELKKFWVGPDLKIRFSKDASRESEQWKFFASRIGSHQMALAIGGNTAPTLLQGDILQIISTQLSRLKT